MGEHFKYLTVTTGTVLAVTLASQAALAAQAVDSQELRKAVTVENIVPHLEAFETFGPRVPGSPEYDDAAGYVSTSLMSAGYQVTWQPFAFDLWEEFSNPILNRTDSQPVTIYPPYDEAGFATMEYSGSGEVAATVVVAQGFGCNSNDFVYADFTGMIALIERGECTFAEKVENAAAAGAAAAIIYNDQERQDAFLGTLGGPGISIPVVGSSYDIGQQLLGGSATAYLKIDAATRVVQAYNVLAETTTGRDDRVVVVGAHLDGVDGTQAINDNGSGSAMILEIALQMAKLGIEPVNKVRFCFWSAEESGLIGSQHYVDSLSDKEKKKIALNLNFDMVASPNFVRFIYDGDGSSTPEAGPNGSGNIENVLGAYFDSEGLPYEETAFDGRSDYGPFIEAGIPAGGLFTGADEIKTKEQAAIYGGEAGFQLDPNYHTPQDNLNVYNPEVLDQMADAAAHAVLTFGMTKSAVNGTAKATPMAKGVMTYRGPNAQK